ncbi:MAG: NAD(P)-binding domain-containing protein, partial [Candidatus Eremiobacteraeota bacterium]|nr:NAD(P)-binding domain-containing protein [Candidatus Eremiobacteraeota bacterium]
TWPRLIDAMESALARFSSGSDIHPVRTILTIEERARYVGLMPAVAGDVMGLKFVTFYPANAGTEVPTHNATILLYRTANGTPLAAMDGRLITEMRTAAVSAAVTRRLASPGSRVLALLGSGVQASAHLAALRCVRDLSEVRVWSRTHAHAQRFAREHGVTAVPSPEDAVRGADVVVTATAAQEPVLRGAWLEPGTHVNAVGSCRPDWRELDDDAMRATIVVDSRQAVAMESGDVILSGSSIYAEAGEIFSGTKESPPRSTTVFKSVGLACEDIAAAKLVLENAQV